MKSLLTKLERHHLLIFVVLFLTFIFRFPSLFEPFWYGDEGIFAAVGRNLNFGGVLYQTAWDNKPPMIYLTYAGIFSMFGVSMFWLRLVTIVVVLATSAVIYEIGNMTIGKHRALIAAFIFGLITSFRLVEGNLALTEIFMILPISLAIWIAIKRNFDYVSLFASGVLISVASLYKQVGAFEAAALGIYVLLQKDSLVGFIKKGFALSLGFVVPYAITIGYFASKGLVSDYIFGAYTYYKIYLNESPQYAFLINTAKYLPVVSTVFYGLWKKFKGVDVGYNHLLLLWLSLSLLGSYFSGRTYGHYLVQAVPALSLLLASINLKGVSLSKERLLYATLFLLPVLFLTRLFFSTFIVNGPVSQAKYWVNFSQKVTGVKTLDEYNNFFDTNVNTIMALSDFLKMNGGYGKSIYIWGDFPWLYAMMDAKNPSRYVTSFHVFGVPNGQEEVVRDLVDKTPLYIIKPQTSIGHFNELENLLGAKYTLQAKINNADVYALIK
ncbi:MAG: glycosyltransferase family 39 protein [Patescibacteria group bacterium]